MKTLILAAGLGSRLGTRTSDRPKALVEVKGRPILDYQMEVLLGSGAIDSILIVIGYQGQKIIDYISKNYPKAPVTYLHNPEFATSNSSYSFWLARELVQGEAYVHIHCDILFSPSLFQNILSSPHENVIAVKKNVPLGGHLEHVALEGERITEMSITQTSQSTGKAYGLAKFGPRHSSFISDRIGKLIHEGDKNQHYYAMIREVVKEIDYYAVDASSDLLLEVNTPTDIP